MLQHTSSEVNGYNCYKHLKIQKIKRGTGDKIKITMVVYHLHGETGWSMVCANGKQNSHIGNFRLGWRVPFGQ